MIYEYRNKGIICDCRALSEFPAIPQSEVLSYNVNGIVQTNMNQVSSNNHSVIKKRAAEQNGYKRGTSSGGSSSSPLSTASSSGSTVISRWYVYIFTERRPSKWISRFTICVLREGM